MILHGVAGRVELAGRAGWAGWAGRAVLAGLAAVAAVPMPALAEVPRAALSAVPMAVPAAPVAVCTVKDKRLTELSGLAATATGFVAVNDGADEASHRKIFYLDQKCRVVRAVSYPSRPRDTEDLGLAADGTLWVADIGDNGSTRETVGLWRLTAGAKKPQLFRLTYPDGAHNAEALLVTRAGTPIVVTKSIGAASVYLPVGDLTAGGTTALRAAGSVTVPVTGTSNPFGLPGRLVITGGAVSPDGQHVVLRTYADAFEYAVTGDDVVGALTKGTPTRIALPDEPQGESISYTVDGTALLTVSEEENGEPAEIRRYALPARPAVTPSSPAADPAVDPATAPATQAAPQAAPSSAKPAPRAAARDGGVPAGLLVTGGVLLLAATALGALLVRRRR
ncbi:hypothetical protein GCM10010172_83630 [Paractinoplanes ferrugineus]|uniref:Uncharacterized protein n=1 Tax=Paractinoplanes ferrugineus TaxID=113564 RepID=A0A919MDK4_9ACTN|nr:hypothetical protein [Actinoplanes ferrugineus]GIE10684.1 hypothetical protein Afe05nite_25240 [Actinoplanes ferrugineus]